MTEGRYRVERPARRLVGRVRSGLGDCGFWLAKLEEHYRTKTGMTLFPGTLNVELPEPFSLPSQRLRLEGHEYGGRIGRMLVLEHQTHEPPLGDSIMFDTTVAWCRTVQRSCCHQVSFAATNSCLRNDSASSLSSALPGEFVSPS